MGWMTPHAKSVPANTSHGLTSGGAGTTPQPRRRGCQCHATRLGCWCWSGARGEGHRRACPERFVVNLQHSQHSVAVEVTSNDLTILVSTHSAVRVSTLDARAIPSHNHKNPHVRVVLVCVECFLDTFLACHPNLQEGGTLGAGLVQYLRWSHWRWCFLGVCSILDAFQIFVVLEVKDLFHFQSPRTMSVCAALLTILDLLKILRTEVKPCVML